MSWVYGADVDYAHKGQKQCVLVLLPLRGRTSHSYLVTILSLPRNCCQKSAELPWSKAPPPHHGATMSHRAPSRCMFSHEGTLLHSGNAVILLGCAWRSFLKSEACDWWVVLFFGYPSRAMMSTYLSPGYQLSSPTSDVHTQMRLWMPALLK